MSGRTVPPLGQGYPVGATPGPALQDFDFRDSKVCGGPCLPLGVCAGCRGRREAEKADALRASSLSGTTRGLLSKEALPPQGAISPDATAVPS